MCNSAFPSVKDVSYRRNQTSVCVCVSLCVCTHKVLQCNHSLSHPMWYCKTQFKWQNEIASIVSLSLMKVDLNVCISRAYRIHNWGLPCPVAITPVMRIQCHILGLAQAASPNPFFLAYPDCVQNDFWKSWQISEFFYQIRTRLRFGGRCVYRCVSVHMLWLLKSDF